MILCLLIIKSDTIIYSHLIHCHYENIDQCSFKEETLAFHQGGMIDYDCHDDYRAKLSPFFVQKINKQIPASLSTFQLSNNLSYQESLCVIWLWKTSRTNKQTWQMHMFKYLTFLCASRIFDQNIPQAITSNTTHINSKYWINICCSSRVLSKCSSTLSEHHYWSNIAVYVCETQNEVKWWYVLLTSWLCSYWFNCAFYYTW